jgi:hypothetical protein
MRGRKLREQIRYIIQNWETSAGLILFGVVHTEEICVSVGLDLPLQRRTLIVQVIKVLRSGGCLNRKEVVAGG